MSQRQLVKLLMRVAEEGGAQVLGTCSMGHHTALVLEVGGTRHRLPMGHTTGHGRARHEANAVAQLRRIIRGIPPSRST